MYITEMDAEDKNMRRGHSRDSVRVGVKHNSGF